jgi:hypothetical protein
MGFGLNESIYWTVLQVVTTVVCNTLRLLFEFATFVWTMPASRKHASSLLVSLLNFWLHFWTSELTAESESYVTTDAQSASLSWYKAPIWGLRPDFYFRSEYGIRLTVTFFFSVVRPLWREDGSVFCMCLWPLPAQSFSGPSPLGLEPVFYCLRFETSLFVASYDSQGHGGGIRPRLHTGNALCPTALNYPLQLTAPQHAPLYSC